MQQPAVLSKPVDKTQLAWLLNAKMTRKEFNAHLKELIPKIAPADIRDGRFRSDLYQDLAYQLDEQSASASINKPDIVDNRYVLIYNGVTPTDLSFAWIDTQAGTSIVGNFSTSIAEVDIVSNNYTADTVPAVAKTALTKLFKVFFDTEPPINFYDNQSKKMIAMKVGWLQW